MKASVELVKRLCCDRLVVCSIPSGGAEFFLCFSVSEWFFVCVLNQTY